MVYLLLRYYYMENIISLMQSQIQNKVYYDEVQSLENELLSHFVEGTLFVINNNHTLYGIITDGDVRKCFTDNKCDSIQNSITKTPITISQTDTLSNALLLLRKNQINILAVIDENNLLVGYITLHMLIDSFSPERLYIKDGENTLDANEQRHLARYKFATNFILKNSTILDCACGSGYGSKLLSEEAKELTGVDLSQDAIDFATKNNSALNITYKQSDLSKLSFEDSYFDNILSIETLEHIPHNIFLQYLSNISKWLKKGGVFVGSSPMLRYKDDKPYITNPYHINEMPKHEFIDAINSRLKNFEIHFYYQDQDKFLPLCNENTGFCIVVARKK